MILESQLISGVGFIVLNVWRYSFSYFYFLKAYHAYSTFTCLSAVFNSKNQKAAAFGILVLALAAEWLTKFLLFPNFVKETQDIRPMFDKFF